MHLLLVLLLLLHCSCTAVVGNVLNIGVILEDGDRVREIAVDSGIQAANSILRRSSNLYGYKLRATVRRMAATDTFQASREACNLLSQGVIAIIGPGSSVASEQVRSVCAFFAVPHIETVWHSRAADSQHYSVNLCPHPDSHGTALLEFARSLTDWHHFAVIYKDASTLMKYEQLINSIERPAMLRQWQTDRGTRHRSVMKELKAGNVYKFFVDIPATEVLRFLIIAQSMNMTSEYHSYIFTSWDVERIDLSDFRSARAANISTLSMLPAVAAHESYNRTVIVETMRSRLFEVESKISGYKGRLTNMLPTSAALLHDTLVLLAHALDGLARSIVVAQTPLSCSRSGHLMQMGPSLLNYMRSMPQDISRQTLTGSVKFNEDRRRVNFTLIAHQVMRGGFTELGTWRSDYGFNVTRRFEEVEEERQTVLQNKTLRVVTVADAPFVFIKQRDENNRTLPQPSAWDGFCIEMLNLIAKDVGFNYTVHLSKDGKYGTGTRVNASGKETWNGMIGELMNKEADLAVASLTITYEREIVIDFTTPYMSLGLSILFKKPEKTKPHLFSFLQPLSVEVWGYMLAAYVTVSFALFAVARFSPYEWYNPHPCNTNPTEVENQFSLLNSLWFTIGSLMQQGSEIAPRAMSTRLISGMWWFFTLIMISSYTANLAAFLTVERMQSPIESAEDLAAQTNIEYGTLNGGSTYEFFERATSIQTFTTMWKYMKARPWVFVNETEEGVERVLKGGYAFILESTMNEYYTHRNCSLMRVGGLLDSKGYGIGLQPGSPYRDRISESILKYQKLQELEKLRLKWWRQNNISEPCKDPTETKSEPPGLGIDQVAGVYVVLLAGMVVGMVATACEFCYKAMKRSEHDRQPLTTELCEELQFAISCFGGSTRPVNHLAQRARKAKDRTAAGNNNSSSSSRQMRRLAAEVQDVTDFDCSGSATLAPYPGVMQQQLLQGGGSLNSSYRYDARPTGGMDFYN